MKLTDIITSAIAVFETCLSKALRNGKIDEEEVNVLQTFHLKTLNELSDVDRKMGAENRNQFEKSLLKEINDIKKLIETRPSLLLFVLSRVLLSKIMLWLIIMMLF